MAASPRRICWDACTWIALIQREQGRYEACRAVLALAEQGNVEIVVSGLCLVEVCKSPPTAAAGDPDQIAAFFDTDYIMVVPVDRAVGNAARKLMMSRHPGLKPPDATHIATALLTNCNELNTFDGVLLALDGN